MKNIRLVLLDWGDTIMVDFSAYQGPMVEWPYVEAVNGVQSALEKLAGRFQFVLASNAGESSGYDAHLALNRAGIGDYFQHIFTAKDLKTTKNDPAFYQRILEKLDVLPEHAVMVGDYYPLDILSASRAGLNSIWFNPEGSPCPQTQPQHEAEIRSMEDLPLVLEHTNLPTLAACLDYLRGEAAPPNLIEHCLGVAACAYWTASWMKKAGVFVDPLLAHRGGLLHDLDKITGREQGIPHGEWSSKLLHQWGYPLLAKIAESHVISRILNSARSPETWEEKVVFYTDKLVEGGGFVGLVARLQALKERYPGYAAQMNASKPLIESLEDEILEITGYSMEEYYNRLEALDFNQYIER
jgi:putative nucleotidyltransferase with HDIG domain